MAAEARLEGEAKAKADLDERVKTLQATVGRVEAEAARGAAAQAAADVMRDQVRQLTDTAWRHRRAR